jgi:hypothetical protein
MADHGSDFMTNITLFLVGMSTVGDAISGFRKAAASVENTH